jgi:Flp pilus assembly protein TadD
VAPARALLAFVLLLFAPLVSCSIALKPEEIARFEGFSGNAQAKASYDAAEKMLAGGRPAEALLDVEILRARFSDNILVHRLYQECKLALGERAQLLKEYTALAESRPSALHFTLLSRLQEDANEGALLARRAYEIDDLYPWAWYTYGFWIAKLGNDNQRAEAALRRALALSPDFFPALRAYAVLMRDTDARAAVDAIERYIESYSPGGNERILLASMRLGLGRDESEAAEREFRKLLQERPGDPECNKGLAAALLELDRVAEAKAIYETLQKQRPDDWSLEFNLGVVAELEGKPATAREHYQRYIDKGVDEPILLLSRARLWIQEIDEQIGSKPAEPAAGDESRPASASRTAPRPATLPTPP